MKKVIVVFMIVAMSILSACNSPEMSLKEVEKVPAYVQENIDQSLQLQFNSDGKNGYYIIFHSDGGVKADFDKKGDTVTVKFDVSNSQADEKKQDVYFLTTDNEIENIEVLINGEPAVIDNFVA